MGKGCSTAGKAKLMCWMGAMRSKVVWPKCRKLPRGMWLGILRCKTSKLAANAIILLQ